MNGANNMNVIIMETDLSEKSEKCFDIFRKRSFNESVQVSFHTKALFSTVVNI